MTSINNPQNRASQQSQPSALSNWDESFRRIMALTTVNPHKFASQPRANRFDQILEAAVPSRNDPTHEKVLAIVNALVENGAVRSDEGGQIFNALLERVSRYNSSNVQTNLERLVTDVREAVARKERASAEPSLASLVTLNAFISELPAVVPKGQEDYLAFISALRTLVSEVPQTDVYRSGPNYYFSTNKSGSQTVNLNNAFDNLRPLWGVRSAQASQASVSSILTPNTRLLLLMVAPFTDAVSISRDSYIGHLLTLYRETIGQTRFDETTYNEITSVSKAIGNMTEENLQSTLNFLLTNRKHKVPQVYSLSEEEERILRYVQQAVSLYLMQDGATPSSALDMTAANLEPSFYAKNRFFINRLMDYFHRAAALSPNYFTNAVLNANWLPPEGFYTGDFDDFPEQEDLVWDDSNDPVPHDLDDLRETYSRLEGATASDFFQNELEDVYEKVNGLESASPTPTPPVNEERTWIRPSRFPYNRYVRGEDEYLDRAREDFRWREEVNRDSQLDSLISRLDGWKTYAQLRREGVETDDGTNDRGRKLGGRGDPFAHLKPKGRITL
ncbi:pIIIa [Equine adenovirus 2]|uniref:Pre-hexon-linking protein IIIa n=1 Tax=Equine adenovirus B serotype 2 TaxID=67603 RepID=A0A0K1DBV0_ADEE2|nr:pIIIa [Equine adenovirus 2]AKT26026.1 pIIIa [Equine adenovirus 2]